MSMKSTKRNSSIQSRMKLSQSSSNSMNAKWVKARVRIERMITAGTIKVIKNTVILGR